MSHLPFTNHCQQYKHVRLYCWQWVNFAMGPNEQNQHFAELSGRYTRSRAPKKFAKFVWATRTFCPKKVEKAVAKLSSQTDYKPN